MGSPNISILQGQIQLELVEMSLQTPWVFGSGPKYLTNQEGTLYIILTGEDSYFLSLCHSVETSPETVRPSP